MSRTSLAFALAVCVKILIPQAAFADASPASAFVDNTLNDGTGSFRAAVAAANANPDIRRIVFARNLDIALDADVVYTGNQSLTVLGNGSALIGSPDAVPAETWDGGLFVSSGGANLSIQDLDFIDSFNNGLAVFVPSERSGTISLTLSKVSVDAARFHGVFFDGQSTTGFNTDDVIHPDCVDPYPVDSPASMRISVRRASITNNGTLAGGFNTGTPFEIEGETFLTGCPADFDGIRVDDGGDGGIYGSVFTSVVNGNLADGIEFDDTGAGSVDIYVSRTEINDNGETGTDDLDDGLDLDEAGPGDLRAFVLYSELRGNRDEGLDFDEAGEGSAQVFLHRVNASLNEDEGFKVDEEDAGDLVVTVLRSSINDSLSQDGADFTETGDGSFKGFFLHTEIRGNDNDAINAAQEDAGAGTLKTFGGDFTGNGNPSLDLDGIDATVIGTRVDE